MGTLRWPVTLAITITLTAQVGCSSSSPPKQPNLRPTAVTVLTPAQDVQASHRLDVEVGIFSETTIEGVGVAFRAFPRAAYDAHDENIESHVLGSSAHDVPAGGGTFVAQLEIPYEVPSGEYYVVPEVDPLDTIAETDEEDQVGVVAPLVVRVEHRDHPRLMIEGGVMDVPAFELSWVLGGAPEPLGLTLLVRAEGFAPVQEAQITACVRGPDTDCVALPLGIWDSAAGRHLPQLVVPELLPGEPTSVHLDLHFGPELATVFEALLTRVANACLGNVPACVETYGMLPACVQDCLAPVLTDPAHADTVALQGCLLKCLPFTVEATIDKPGAILFEPANATPGRSHEVDLQLLAPPPPSPVVASALTIRPLADPVVRPVNDSWFGWIWSPVSLEFAADKGSCAEAVLWSVQLVPDQPLGSYTSPGTIIGTDLAASYVPPLPSDPDRLTTKVVVQASACGEAATALVTLIGRNPSLVVEPAELAVTAGGEGAAEFQAVVTDCPPNPPVEWTLIADDPRLEEGPGSLSAAGPLAVAYRPPRSIAMGPPVTVTVQARSLAAPPCNVEGTAAIALGLAEELSFEKAYTKGFENSLFGAGVDLYAGAFLNRDGGKADGHARVPVKVFGQAFDLVSVTDHASVDPRPAGESHFLHQIEAFGFTVNTMHCPGDPICTGTADIWSDSKCKPDGPPPVCVGASYLTPCRRSTECAANLRCMDGRCTRKCDGSEDCPGGSCLGSLAPGPYKRVFVIVVVPVTVEGKICVDYGIEAKLNLLEPVADEFSATLGPFVEVGGYASAAAGYTGLLALGVRGEIVLLRDDFYGKTSANVFLVPQGVDCPHAAGCIQGALRESVENVVQGGKGRVYLFADYPTLRWCRWYPCIGTARARKTLASWGPLFEVAHQCDWCSTSTQCPVGVQCVDGMCDDGFPGLLCRQQKAFVSAQ